MSSTNRGSVRQKLDAYYTPEATIHNFLNAYNCDMNGFNILEPTAGEGSICKVIREKYPTVNIWANEINDEKRCVLEKYSDTVTCKDFLHIDKIENTDIIISNPPFGQAQEIIEHCFEVSKGKSVIIMLLRLAFLESKRRYDFWQKHPVNGLYILSQRPSFTNGGTDSCAYGFFCWDGTKHQEIKVI